MAFTRLHISVFLGIAALAWGLVLWIQGTPVTWDHLKWNRRRRRRRPLFQGRMSPAGRCTVSHGAFGPQEWRGPSQAYLAVALSPPGDARLLQLTSFVTW